MLAGVAGAAVLLAAPALVCVLLLLLLPLPAASGGAATASGSVTFCTETHVMPPTWIPAATAAAQFTDAAACC